MDSSSVPLRKPKWLKVQAPGSHDYIEVQKLVDSLKLHTVCKEARCPNIGECWGSRTATFLILGETCTRACSFCAVKHALGQTLPLPDATEPQKVGEAVKQLGLKHAVITSVTRDDLPDGGAEHYAKTVRAIHKEAPSCTVELLISDLLGSKVDLTTILEAGINILNHNLETVKRLYPRVRPQGDYQRSLNILRWAKEINPNLRTKSGIMVGLSETKEEVLSLMDDLRDIEVDIMTIGQYLRPSDQQLPVKEYITPQHFEEYKQEGLKRGFLFVESAPFVRSSYHAREHVK